MKPVKAIFFDMDHTLIDCLTADTRSYEIVARIARQQIPQINTPELIHRFKQLMKDAPFDTEKRIPVHPWRVGLWQKALNAQGVNHAGLAEKLNITFHSDRLAFYTFTNDVQDLLNQLLQKYTGVIITNGDPVIQRPKLKACQAEKYFRHIIVGGEEPLEKPHPEIFFKACEVANCQPSEAIMVGDRLNTDIAGGLNAGLKATVWVNPSNESVSDEQNRPHYQIISVLELPAILNLL